MKVLVTGGAGFIGSNFARSFAKGLFPEISSIVILDNLSYAGNIENLQGIDNSSSNVEFIQGDITNFKLVSEITDYVDAIINFAAESHVDRSIISSTEFVQSNYVGIQVILDVLRSKSKKIRLLQVSTDEVYGDVRSGFASEDYGYYPNSPYSASKAGAELLIRAYQTTHKIEALITRGCNTFGPFQNKEKLIPKTICNILARKKVPIYGSGKNIREWISVDKHCSSIYDVLVKGNHGEIYNIGSGNLKTNLEIVKFIAKELEVDESLFEYVVDRKGHDFRYAMSNEKYNFLVKENCNEDFQQKLVDTINWYKENRSYWETEI